MPTGGGAVRAGGPLVVMLQAMRGALSAARESVRRGDKVRALYHLEQFDAMLTTIEGLPRRAVRGVADRVVDGIADRVRGFLGDDDKRGRR